MEMVDLFPDGCTTVGCTTIGGNVVEAPSTAFPRTLDQPAEAKRAVITPFPDITSTVFAPLEDIDLAAALIVGLALQLGPDFLLAPAGLVSDKGIRPGYALEAVIGSVLTPDDQWLRDRREELATTAPLVVRAPIFALFVAAGLLVSRLLLVALEDQSFVVSLGICACIGAGFLEVIREPLPTREERDTQAGLIDEFMVFAVDEVAVGGRCHETEIVRAFRAFYPRYRSRDMARSADGESLDDSTIRDLVRTWNSQIGRPGERTSSGYWKGISLKAQRPSGSGAATATVR